MTIAEITGMEPDQKSLGYMPTLDGVRGLACLLVVIQHLDMHLQRQVMQNPIGSLGVMLFFSLSGFLMGALYLDKKYDFDRASAYIVSRASRIAPCYYIAIVFCWVLYLVIPDFSYQMTPLNLARAFAFMGSEGVFWSIPPEVQFYGFFFFVWFAYAKAKDGTYLWLVMAGGIAFLFAVTRDLWTGLLLPSKAHVFLLGVLAAQLLKKLMDKGIVVPAWAQLVLGLSMAGYYATIGDTEKMYDDIIFAALVALTIMSLSVETSLTRIFKTTFMRLLGAASFSIYLFHDAIMQVIVHFVGTDFYPVAVPLFLMVGIGVGAPLLFHIYCERNLNKRVKDLGLEYVAVFKRRFITS